MGWVGRVAGVSGPENKNNLRLYFKNPHLNTFHGRFSQFIVNWILKILQKNPPRAFHFNVKLSKSRNSNIYDLYLMLSIQLQLPD